MSIFRSIMWAMQEDEVVLPPRAGEGTVADGVALVRALEERIRREEDARRKEAERRRAEEEAFHSEPERETKRYHTRFSHEYEQRLAHQALLERIRCVVPDGVRRPPDLKAAKLSFSARLVKYVKERCGGKAPIAYKCAGIDRKLYSRIVSDDRSQVAKQTALQLAIGLQLGRREATEFLNAAGYALSPTIPADCVFEYCIDHRIWNILDVNSILVEAGLPALKLSL